MNKKKHYLVYKTTNLVNGKIYIGKHETDNLDDGYLGSGNLLGRAIEKYGRENFKREIMFECSSKEEMNAREAEFVNEEFLKRDDVYNIKLGGQGGFDFINSTGINNSSGNAGKGGQKNGQLLREDSNYRKNCCEKISKGLRRVWKEHPETFKNFTPGWSGKHHSEESKEKIRKAMQQCTGDRNNSWGTKWMYNEELKITRRVKANEIQKLLSEGWKFGAIYKWVSNK